MRQRSDWWAFGGATPAQKQEADLFLADLLGHPGPAARADRRRRAGRRGADWASAWPPVESNIDQVGECSLRRAGSAAPVPVWPLPPGTTIAAATPPAGAAPALAFGIVDVVIRPAADALVTTSVAAPAMAAPIDPAATVTSMPLALEADRTIRFAFAVAPNAGAADFVGTLRLTVRRGTAAPGIATQIEVPVRVRAGARVADLVIFLVPHVSASARYAWTKLKVTRQGAPATVLAGVDVQAKLLRDNLTFRGPNRTIALTTDAGGFAAAPGGRNVVALPIDWPLILTATSASSVPRGHLVRLAAADIHDNSTPHQPAAIEVTPTASARLAGRRIMLDAGHGVVYGLAAQRRSQEWFVAHRVCERVAELLRARHGVAAADIFQTRTAGFGLIDPTELARDDAPERGDARFTFDLPGRRVRAAAAATSLKAISDLLLVQHTGAADTPQAVTAADRARLLAASAATVTAIETRLDAALAPARRVRPGSIRWDATADNYIFTREPTGGGAGATSDAALPIDTTDWFTVDDPMMRNLADRSARWSRRSEIGSGPAAAGARPSFVAAARAAMDAAGAVDYMRDRILQYVNVAAPHPWLDHGIKSWGPTARVDFMNTTACDLYISVHENAAGGVGGMALVSAATAGAARPPDAQIRLGKVFLKYLDPFDQGLRQGGIERESRPATMLGSTNTRRATYAYLEIEFMDAIDPADATRYRYQSMVTAPFIDRVAEQIVSAIAEALLSPQNTAGITLNGAFLDTTGAAIW